MKIFRTWHFLSRAEKITILLLSALAIGLLIMVFSRCTGPTTTEYTDYTDWMNEDKGNESEQVFWPLEEGSWWHYQSEGENIGDEVTVTVIDEEQSETNGAQYFVEFDYQSHTTVEHYGYDRDGLLWYGLDLPVGNYQRQPPQYLVKFPVDETHDWSWQGELLPVQGEELNYRGEATMQQDGLEKVELPVGRKEGVKIYHSTIVEMDGERREIEEIRGYVPGIGLVKQEVIEDGEVQLKKLLIDYELVNNKET